MNLTQFAHNVGIALRHAGAINADPQLVSWAIERDALPEYVAATVAARVLASGPQDSPLAMGGFRPVVIDGVLAYGHQTTTGRLTVDLFPDEDAATLRFEAGGGQHILSLDVVFVDGTVYTVLEAGELELLDGREDRLNLLQRIDQQCGGCIRRALEDELAGPVYAGEYVAGVQRLLDALDAADTAAA